MTKAPVPRTTCDENMSSNDSRNRFDDKILAWKKRMMTTMRKKRVQRRRESVGEERALGTNVEIRHIGGQRSLLPLLKSFAM